MVMLRIPRPVDAENESEQEAEGERVREVRGQGAWEVDAGHASRVARGSRWFTFNVQHSDFEHISQVVLL